MIKKRVLTLILMLMIVVCCVTEALVIKDMNCLLYTSDAADD